MGDVLTFSSVWPLTTIYTISGFLHPKLSPNDALSTLFEELELTFKNVKVQGHPQTRFICIHSGFQEDVKWFKFDFKNGPALHFPSAFCYIPLSRKGFSVSSAANRE